MRKLLFVALALILALGTLGVGYAMWSDTLTVTGYVNNGWVDVNFHSQYDNDINSNDPKEAGSWSGFPSPVWTGNRYTKNVASTTSTWSVWNGQYPSETGNTATITITNAYPSYWGSVMWDVQNDGSIPVKLESVTLVKLSKNAVDTWSGSFALTIGTRYYVDVDTSNIDTTLDAGDDFSFILSAIWCDQIDPATWEGTDGLGFLDVTVHVEQDSEQKTAYDFVIDYLFANWND